MVEYLSAINRGSKNYSLDNSLLRRTSNGIYFVRPNTKKGPIHFFHLVERLGDADMTTQEMEEGLLKLPSYNNKVRSGTYSIEPLQTKLGHKIGRVARPTQGWGGMMTLDETDDFTSIYFDRIRNVLHLHEKLLEFGRIVDLAPSNLEVHGNVTRDLLLLACFEVEALFKLLIYEDFQTARGNIAVYWKVSESAKLPDYSVCFPDMHSISPLKPFSGWGTGETKYTPLTWYQSYNSIKHNAIEGNGPATLGIVLEAVAGCYVLLSALNTPTIQQLSNNKRLMDTFRGSFKLVSKAQWTAGEHYWRAPGKALRFLEVC